MLAVVLWASLVERSLYVIRRQTIEVLPKGSKPIRVLQLGDIHLAPWQRYKMKFLSSLASSDVDLVVDTGDNLGHKAAIEPLLSALRPLLSKPGVFVHGSNDYYAPVIKNPFGYIFHSSAKPKSDRLNTDLLTRGFENAGWKNLNNAEASLEIGGNKIRFIGVDDYHIGLSEFEKLSPGSDFTIALTHAPYLKVIEKLTRLGSELIFAGHTHGGQVRLPVIGALTTNSDLPNKYARGVSRWNFGERSSILSVTAGLGNSIYAPVRFFCKPEVRLITLVAKN